MDSLHRQIDALRAEATAKYEQIKLLETRIEQLELELKTERQKQFKRKKQQPAGADTADHDTPPGRKKRGALEAFGAKLVLQILVSCG